jgi:lysophospholipase L1-like esterase
MLLTRRRQNVLTEGDSITDGYTVDETAVTSYADLYTPTEWAVLAANTGASGSSLAGVVSRGATDDAHIVSHKVNIITCLIGANDLGTYEGATDAVAAANYTEDLLSWVASRRSAGWNKIGLVTIISRVSFPAFEARRAIVNANILSEVGGDIDFAVDFASTLLGVNDAATSHPTLFMSDGIHPSQTGQTDHLLPVFEAALRGV